MVPRTCTVCLHPLRVAIDAALVGGLAVRKIAERYAGLSASAVARHSQGCLSGAPTRAIKALAKTSLPSPVEHRAFVTQAFVESSLSRTRRLIDIAQSRLDEAPKASITALEAMRELGRLIELEAKLSGELVRKSEATVTSIQVQTPREALALMDRLRPALQAQADEDEAAEGGKH